MAKNKSKAAEARWLAKRQRMGPPGPDEPRFHPKQGRRYNYADQLKTIMAGSIESKLDQLTAARGELIVTLNLCGAQFWVAVGMNPRTRNDGDCTIDSLDVPPTLDELNNSSLHVTCSVKVPHRYHEDGQFKSVDLERSINGIIYPAHNWPEHFNPDQMVSYQMGRRDPRVHWAWDMRRGYSCSYEEACKRLPAFLYEGEYWNE